MFVVSIIVVVPVLLYVVQDVVGRLAWWCSVASETPGKWSSGSARGWRALPNTQWI